MDEIDKEALTRALELTKAEPEGHASGICLGRLGARVT
jgi:hypothetical protein